MKALALGGASAGYFGTTTYTANLRCTAFSGNYKDIIPSSAREDSQRLVGNVVGYEKLRKAAFISGSSVGRRSFDGLIIHFF